MQPDISPASLLKDLDRLAYKLAVQSCARQCDERHRNIGLRTGELMAATGRLTFVLGGARSGKSRHAEELVSAFSAPWIYVATAQAFDDEMRDRIEHHRGRRGENWQTLEAPLDLVEILQDVPEGAPVLIDCLTLWLTNVMLGGRDVAAESARLTDALSRPRGPWFVVSNEVGLGIVPENALARRFRDAAGRLNQAVAAKADSVIFMVAGLPMTVK